MRNLEAEYQNKRLQPLVVYLVAIVRAYPKEAISKKEYAFTQKDLSIIAIQHVSGTVQRAACSRGWLLWSKTAEWQRLPGDCRKPVYPSLDAHRRPYVVRDRPTRKDEGG